MSNADVDGAMEERDLDRAIETLTRYAGAIDRCVKSPSPEWCEGVIRDEIRNLRERLEVQDEKLSELCDCGDHVATAMFCPVHDTENWRNVEEDYSRLARELHAARRRADRLEERARAVVSSFRMRGRCGRCQSPWPHDDDSNCVIARLRSALDSREDEGEREREVHEAAREVLRRFESDTETEVPAGTFNALKRLGRAIGRYGDDSDLPTIWDLHGLEPDATGDLSSEEFTKRLRGSDTPVHADEPEGDEEDESPFAWSARCPSCGTREILARGNALTAYDVPDTCPNCGHDWLGEDGAPPDVMMKQVREDPAPHTHADARSEPDLRSRIREVLDDFRCQHLRYDEYGGGMQLVDVLSPKGGSIEPGKKELDRLADEIAYRLSDAPSGEGERDG